MWDLHFILYNNNHYSLLMMKRWCTTPIYTLSARGHLQLREPSWVVPGAAEAEYTLHRVTIVAYSEDVVDQVMQRVNRYVLFSLLFQSSHCR